MTHVFHRKVLFICESFSRCDFGGRIKERIKGAKLDSKDFGERIKERIKGAKLDSKDFGERIKERIKGAKLPRRSQMTKLTFRLNM